MQTHSGTSNQVTNQTTKIKRTRKRLRLSCVECAKRRQKCDRNQPCGLCVTRGVAHLCRWETVPMARPPPQRPPGMFPQQNTDQTRSELLAHIASLEQTISQLQQESQAVAQASIEMGMQLNNHQAPVSLPLAAPNNVIATPNSLLQGSVLSHVLDPTRSISEVNIWSSRNAHQNTYAASAAIAQMAYAHYGEYLGRGSIVCSLYLLGSMRIPYAKSTDATSGHIQLPPELTASLIFEIGKLVAALPSQSATRKLLQGYFAEVNWRFGIPEGWFYTACKQMWTALTHPHGNGMQINPHWLSLLFSVLAFAPKNIAELNQPTVDQDIFFIHALTARRVAEDACLATPLLLPLESVADGTVLGCLAAPLLGNFLAEKGMVSEAWKLVGVSLRNALAVGLHRDPGLNLWQLMSENERLLRVRAWWGLIIWDHLFSSTVGRPPMVKYHMSDVTMPCKYNPDGSRSQFGLYQFHFAKFAGVVAEVMEACFNIAYPTGPQTFDADRKFIEWEVQLPSEYSFRPSARVIVETTEAANVARQRYSLQTWYLACRMRLHRAFITRVGHSKIPQTVSQDPFGHKSRAQLLSIAAEAVRFKCEVYAFGNNWCFEGLYVLLDATVSLITAMTLLEEDKRPLEVEELVARAVDVLKDTTEYHGAKSKVARVGLHCLQILEQEQNWKPMVASEVVQG